jgi:hypothetical protein
MNSKHRKTLTLVFAKPYQVKDARLFLEQAGITAEP